MEKRIGFCRSCNRNSVHCETSGLVTLIDNALFGLLRRFRLANWHCIDCGTLSAYLRHARPAVLSKPKFTDGTSRKLNDQAQTSATKTSAGSASSDRSSHAVQSSAGNFLRNDQSLVMRSARSDRFTDKFKDGIVQRILSGTTTIADVRAQHHLTEQDVIDWMKQSFDRKQKRVDDLTHKLRLTESTDRERIIKIASARPRIAIQNDVIEADVIEADVIQAEVIEGRAESKQN